MTAIIYHLSSFTSRQEFYRQYKQARIMGFAVTARSRERSAQVILNYGGISYDYLKLTVIAPTDSICQIGVIVFTDKLNPEMVTTEPQWFKKYQQLCVIS